MKILPLGMTSLLDAGVKCVQMIRSVRRIVNTMFINIV